ncbi:MAG: tetratricopeptide repeat protein [Chloroflexi bacterium]|nr:tetratricopeptide repeat protein [Chloroflexota bacterium]
MDADSSAPTKGLRIHLLGQFRADYEGEPVSSLGQPRLCFLLAYLLLHRGVPISRQQLAFAFWPDTSDDQARSNLRTVLHRLRDALPDGERYLVLDRHTVLWRPEATLSLDVADFEAVLAAAQRAADREAERRALQEAVEAYTGDLLSDCYDDWIAPIRERLSQAARAALERLLVLLEERGEYRGALQYDQRLLRHDPLHEATYRQLMRLHALSGDRTGVVRVFHTCETVLRRELDVSPAAETRAAYQASLKQAATSAAIPQPRPPISGPQRHNLPLQLTNFIGRAREAEQIRGLLAAHRLVTLTGSGGVGKTSLALRVATDLLPTFADGAWWVNLEAVADEALVAQTVAHMLDVREAAGCSLSQALADHLHDKRLLLMLDNCEHLSGRVGQLAQDLLRAAPQLSILVTSQRALGIPGELVWRVPSLTVPSAAPPRAISAGSVEPAPAAGLGQYESVRLFVVRGQAILPTFALTDANAREISLICRRLDGIPLALELAAAHIRTLTPQQIALRLDDALGLLAREAAARPARHQTLEAAVAWSHELLAQRERILFRRLAVFAGSFTLAAVEAICAGHGIAPDAILELLAGLEDKSMLESEATPTEVRFRLHEVIRQYALARLADADETDRTRARHLDYYGRLVAEAGAKLTGSEQGAWLDRLEVEHDNLAAALGCSQGADSCRDAGLRMVGGLARFWATRGYFGEGRYWARTLLAAPAEVATTPGRLAGLTAAASLAYYQGDYAEARGLYTQALAAAQALGDKGAVATITRGLGTIAHAQGECAVALSNYEASLTACREIGDRWGEATARANLGLALWQHGDHVTARGHLAACLDLRRELGDETGIAYVLNVLGDMAWSEGKPVEAQKLNEESLLMRRRLGDKWGIAYSLDSLGLIARGQRDWARAHACFAECLTLFHDLGSQRATADTLDHIAGLLADEGNPQAADQLMAAAAARRESLAAVLPPSERAGYDEQLTRVRSQLGDEGFRAAWTLGRAASLDQTVSYALRLLTLS